MICLSNPLCGKLHGFADEVMPFSMCIIRHLQRQLRLMVYLLPLDRIKYLAVDTYGSVSIRPDHD